MKSDEKEERDCRTRQRNVEVLQMRPQKPRPSATARIHPCSKIITVVMFISLYDYTCIFKQDL